MSGPRPCCRVPGGLLWVSPRERSGRSWSSTRPTSGIGNWPERPGVSGSAREILEKKLPELDDNFARAIDPNLDLEGLKAKLRVRFESEELMQSRERLETSLVDRLLDENSSTVPEGMVEEPGRIMERAREDGRGS